MNTPTATIQDYQADCKAAIIAVHDYDESDGVRYLVADLKYPNGMVEQHLVTLGGITVVNDPTAWPHAKK